MVRASGFFSRRQSIPIFLLTAFLLASTFQILILLRFTSTHQLQTNTTHTHILYNSSSFTSHSFFRSISNGKLHKVWKSDCATVLNPWMHQHSLLSVNILYLSAKIPVMNMKHIRIVMSKAFTRLIAWCHGFSHFLSSRWQQGMLVVLCYLKLGAVLPVRFNAQFLW